jgi:hypothetical protein
LNTASGNIKNDSFKRITMIENKRGKRLTAEKPTIDKVPGKAPRIIVRNNGTILAPIRIPDEIEIDQKNARKHTEYLCHTCLNNLLKSVTIIATPFCALIRK